MAERCCDVVRCCPPVRATWGGHRWGSERCRSGRSSSGAIERHRSGLERHRSRHPSWGLAGGGHKEIDVFFVPSPPPVGVPDSGGDLATSFRRSAKSLGRSDLGNDVATSLGPRATSLSDVGVRCYDVVRCGAAVPATFSPARGGRATSLGPRATSQHRSRQGRPSEGATSHPCRATSPHRQGTDEALSQ